MEDREGWVEGEFRSMVWLEGSGKGGKENSGTGFGCVIEFSVLKFGIQVHQIVGFMVVEVVHNVEFLLGQIEVVVVVVRSFGDDGGAYVLSFRSCFDYIVHLFVAVAFFFGCSLLIIPSSEVLSAVLGILLLFFSVLRIV
ncbi:hypothetical protein TIFTF001_028045 [Ficus carica]|uniref:Transmembrane protein n=1 Tax=Ficus carica TaxID=3494 RepID=A0AA88DP61_FICCA|nr:hypothetical protein TIFTF001_028045 [Ficus carica]